MNQELIEQYVSGRLGEAESRAFEDYCVANPEFARQVEYEQRLRAGISVVAKGSTAEFVRQENPLGFLLAAAASVLLAVGAAAYLWAARSPAHSPILASVTLATPRDGTSMRLALVRGSDSAPTLPPDMVRVEIVGLFEIEQEYTVALDRLEADMKIRTIATLNHQRPRSPVSLEVLVDSQQLQPGHYSLVVRKQAPDEEALDFGFVKF